jgi:hypothetical protein
MDDPSSNISTKFRLFPGGEESGILLDRTIYFVPNSVPSNQKVFSAVKNICFTFDEVLQYLEMGKVDKIIFHPLTSSQTRRYIVHWAKIFNPHVVEQLTTHFPSKAVGTNQVA